MENLILWEIRPGYIHWAPFLRGSSDWGRFGWGPSVRALLTWYRAFGLGWPMIRVRVGWLCRNMSLGWIWGMSPRLPLKMQCCQLWVLVSMFVIFLLSPLFRSFVVFLKHTFLFILHSCFIKTLLPVRFALYALIRKMLNKTYYYYYFRDIYYRLRDFQILSEINRGICGSIILYTWAL